MVQAAAEMWNEEEWDAGRLAPSAVSESVAIDFDEAGRRGQVVAVMRSPFAVNRPFCLFMMLTIDRSVCIQEVPQKTRKRAKTSEVGVRDRLLNAAVAVLTRRVCGPSA